MLDKLQRYRQKRELVRRWTGEEQRIKAIINDLRSNQDWTKNLQRSEELGWAELPGLDSCPKPSEARGSCPRDLRGIRLVATDLMACSGLGDSQLDYASLEGVNLASSSLIGTSLKYARIDSASILEDADFHFSNLKDCIFLDVAMARSNFTGADISGADFRGSSMEGCLLSDVTFSAESLLGVDASRPTRFGGEYQRPKLFNPRSDRELLRYVSGELRREVYERSHPAVLSWSWHLLANFGRSPGRLLLWVIVIWFMFGLIYSGMPLPSSLEGTLPGRILQEAAPNFNHTSTGEPAFDTLFEPFYFSAVTFTTLGYGDICPAKGNWKAQLYVSCEAIMGYLLLGLFVSLMVQSEDEFGE